MFKSNHRPYVFTKNTMGIREIYSSNTVTINITVFSLLVCL